MAFVFHSGPQSTRHISIVNKCCNMVTCHLARFTVCMKFFLKLFPRLSFYWASRSEWLLYCQSGPRRGLFIYEGVWHIWYWQQWPQLGPWWVPGVTNCIATTSNISLQSQHLLANQGQNFYFVRVRKPNKESGNKSVFSFSTLIPGHKTQRDKN